LDGWLLSVAVGEGVVVVSCAPVDVPVVEPVVEDPDGIGAGDDEADGAGDDADGGTDEVAPALEDAGGGVIADGAGDVEALGVVAVEVLAGAGVSDDALSVGLF